MCCLLVQQCGTQRMTCWSHQFEKKLRAPPTKNSPENAASHGINNNSFFRTVTLKHTCSNAYTTSFLYNLIISSCSLFSFLPQSLSLHI
mmetsp:Transcript_27652/g.69291  ORF Transcript_27652/g.69291 Transcript_27652/m.69291 type:complete len:89 (+) Transcript_27652:54-320(+)